MKTTMLILTTLVLAAACSNETSSFSPAEPSPQPPMAVAGPAEPEGELPPQATQAAPAVTGTSFRPAEPGSGRIAVPSPEPARPTDEPTVEEGRIGAVELAPLVASGEAILVDVRSASQWRGGHARGAIHIPYPELFARSVELPREKLIALYCT